MNWFLTKMVYRILIGNGNHTPQFDEQFRLVLATDKQAAYDKAKQIGNNEADEFYNDRKQLVQWQFVNVSDIYLLGDQLDGAEVFSQTREVSNGDAYTNFIHQKANKLQLDSVTC